MLILERKLYEEIVIGGCIRVSVQRLGPSKVRLGIVAPRNVRVDRAEVHKLRQQAFAELRKIVIKGKGYGKTEPKRLDRSEDAQAGEADSTGGDGQDLQ